jgi:hypothetical protein
LRQAAEKAVTDRTADQRELESCPGKAIADLGEQPGDRRERGHDPTPRVRRGPFVALIGIEGHASRA